MAYPRVRVPNLVVESVISFKAISRWSILSLTLALLQLHLLQQILVNYSTIDLERDFLELEVKAFKQKGIIPKKPNGYSIRQDENVTIY